MQSLGHSTGIWKTNSTSDSAPCVLGKTLLHLPHSVLSAKQNVLREKSTTHPAALHSTGKCQTQPSSTAQKGVTKVLLDKWICQVDFSGVFYFFSALYTYIPLIVFPLNCIYLPKSSWFWPLLTFLFCLGSGDTSLKWKDKLSRNKIGPTWNVKWNVSWKWNDCSYPNPALLCILGSSWISSHQECCFITNFSGHSVLSFFSEHLFCSFGWCHFPLRELSQYNEIFINAECSVKYKWEDSLQWKIFIIFHFPSSSVNTEKKCIT